MAERITSRANPLCAHFRKLASSRAYRQEAGEFLCDSPKLLREACLWGAPVRTVLHTPGVPLPDLDGADVREVSESVMAAVSPMETPQGVVFTCAMAPPPPAPPPGAGRPPGGGRHPGPRHPGGQ